ncbi:MAG: hypothetical protein RI957_128 [Verrucomicrobiota bacterium]|jgi:signal transduction histidine kinase
MLRSLISVFLFFGLSAHGEAVPKVQGIARWAAMRFTDLSQFETRMVEVDREIRGLPRASDQDARGTHGYHSDFTTDSRSNWIELSWPSGQWLDALALIPTRINTQSGVFANYGFPRSFVVDAIDVQGRSVRIAEVGDTRLDLRWGDPLLLNFPRCHLRSLRMIPTDLPELKDKKNVRGFALAECLAFDHGVNCASAAELKAAYSIDGESGWNIRYLTDMQSPLGPPEKGNVGESLGWHSDLQIIGQQSPWIEIDLGELREFDSFRLFGARGDSPIKGPGFGFPQQMRMEIRSGPDDLPVVVWNSGNDMIPNPGYNVFDISIPRSRARYVRLVVEKPDQPDVLTIPRVLISEWEIRDASNNIALHFPVISNDGYDSIPHDSKRVWSRKGINDGYTSSGRIISDFDWILGLSRRFDLMVEHDALTRKIAAIDSRSRHIANSVLIAILSLIIASLVLMLRRSHLHNAKKIKELRMSISSDLHDEVGSNLATISLLADLPQGSGTGDDSTLKEVKRLATETSLSLREIVDLTLADRTRRPLVERMRDIASLMLCDHQWHLEAINLLELGPLQRRDFIFYFKEALHNVIQHASARMIMIRLLIIEKRMILEIEDDGAGFEYDDAKSLLTLHQRATSLGGKLQVETSRGKGTCLRLDFPLTSHTP